MKSDRVYRLLNTTLTFYGVAVEGQTLVYDIKIDRYLMRPDGSVHMFFFQYDCFVDGKLLIEMRNGCAGFFTDEELPNGKGIQKKQINNLILGWHSSCFVRRGKETECISCTGVTKHDDEKLVL